MSHHKIRIEFLVLTPQRKVLFLRWALEGFKNRQAHSRVGLTNLPAKAA